MIFYTIIPTNSVTQAQLNYSNARSLAAVRTSNDGTLAILKFEDQNGQYFTEYQWFTMAEIGPVLQGSDWTSSE